MWIRLVSILTSISTLVFVSVAIVWPLLVVEEAISWLTTPTLCMKIKGLGFLTCNVRGWG